ncbi:MAG: diguanylate cyclase, partial [Thermostichales cyanobacterium SZTDM-1c_bins_54]
VLPKMHQMRSYIASVRDSSDPGTVLIVDDNAPSRKIAAALLDIEGYRVTEAGSGPDALAQVAENPPDIILLDVSMPGMDGFEVCRRLKAEEETRLIPVVFVTALDDRRAKLMGIEAGGDDFLTKPIRPERLIGAITSRVERYRTLRSLMIRDGLTGLLNHTHLKEQLDLELLRAQKYQQPLAFGMIDLDHFKTVNDSYGHASGDGVLKSLARLLRQRLRQTDIIGRYGGEEFAVILPNTTPVAAVQVMNEIRDGFAQIHHYANGKEFTVTLSCGIAGFPDYGDQRSLCDAADEALYRAKHSGRNCVVLARPQKHREAT